MKKNKFLMGKRSKKKTWAARRWDIVGGHAKKDEEPFDAMKREAFEETGVTIINAVLLTRMDVYYESEKGFFSYYIYMATEWKGKPANTSKEHSKIRWFTKEDFEKIKMAMPEYASLVNDWIKRKQSRK